MSFTIRGIAPRVPGVGIVAVTLALALATAGCGHDHEPYSQVNWYAGGPRQQAAAVPIPVEMEDDGRPAQMPPRADIAKAPDDPSQPWSRNYGSPAATAATPATARATTAHANSRRADASAWTTAVHSAHQVAMAGDAD